MFGKAAAAKRERTISKLPAKSRTALGKQAAKAARREKQLVTHVRP